MEFYNLINQFTFFLTVIIGIWLAFWVYFSGREKKANKYFLGMVLIWICGVIIPYFIFRNSMLSYEILFFLPKIEVATVFLFFVFFYYFSIHFLGEENDFPILNKSILFIAVAGVFLSIFTNLFQKGIEVTKEGLGLDLFLTPVGKIIWLGFVVTITLFISYRFLKNYFEVASKDKLKIQYFLIGISIWIAINLVFNVFFPLFKNTFIYAYFGNYSIIILFGFTAYAITKHELMGIKTLITQVLIVIISIILLVDVILLSDNITIQLLKIGILLAFLYFSRGMVESVRNEKKAREELEKTYKKINIYIKRLKKININLKEKNEDLKALLNVSDVAMDTLNSRKIAQNIVDSIPTSLSHLGYKGGILVLYDRKKEVVYTYALTESKIVKKAKKLLNKSLAEHAENINEVDNLVIKTIKTKEMQIGNKLEDFIAPTVSRKVCGLIQKLVGAKSFISIPLLSGGRIKGTIVFVGIKPKSKIIQRDKEILFGFSSHIGTAIENAQLYEQTERQIKVFSVLNENLKMANIRLKELMEMKNEFLHITSHQLRTPLTTIRGMISMWNNGDFDDLPEKEKKKMLKRIYVSSERLNNITNDMLDSLELEGGFMKFQFKQVSLRAIIKETVDIMRPNFDEKNLYLKFNDSANIPKVEVEPNYIRQVFVNTIDNACKYTRKGGVDIDVKKTGKYAEVIIKDTGIGVSKRDQERIFLKFTRGRRASAENASGSGLGLFIARKIVDAHNGKVEFFSEGSGKGSVVKILLPVKQE